MSTWPRRVELESLGAARVAMALEDHRRRAGAAWPPGGLALEAALIELLKDKSGQHRPGAAVVLEVGRHTRDDGPVMLTYAEAAELLRCSPRTVRRRVAAGEFRAVAVGRLRRLRRADLLKETPHEHQ